MGTVSWDRRKPFELQGGHQINAFNFKVEKFLPTLISNLSIFCLKIQ